MSPNRKKASRMLTVTMASMMALSILSACGDGNNSAAVDEEDTSKAIATYKGGTITENEFNRQKKIMSFMSPEYAQIMEMDAFKEYLVEQQIAFEYLNLEASEEAKEAGKKQADEQIAQMKSQVGDDIFKQLLEEQSLTEGELKGYMVQIMTAMDDMNRKVSDEEIENEFNANKQDYTTATVRHVLIRLTDTEGNERTNEEALKLAKEVKAQLDKGEDFAEVAKAKSEDPGSKDNGGLYEDVAVGQWIEEFKNAVLTQPIDEIGDPVETSMGYHVIKVEKRTERTFADLTAEEKTSIKNTLGAGLIDEFMLNELPGLIESMDIPKSEEGTTDTEATEEETTTPDSGQDVTETTEDGAGTTEEKTEDTTESTTGK